MLKKLRHRLLVLLVIVGLVALPTLAFYLIPRSTGDRFAASLVTLDVDGMRAQLCADASLQATLNDVSDAGDDAASFLAELMGGSLPEALQNVSLEPVRQALRDQLTFQSGYNPISGRYTFQIGVAGTIDTPVFRLEADFEGPDVPLNIRRGFFSACVANL